MSVQERNRFFNTLSVLRARRPSESVKRTSEIIRSAFLKENKDREIPSETMELLDMYAPIIDLATATIYQNSDLNERLFNKRDPRSPEERIHEIAARCFTHVEEGVILEERDIEDIIEKVIAREPLPEEALLLLERIKKNQKTKNRK